MSNTRLFNTIALEINAMCNRHCAFCPVAYNTRPDERMDWGLYTKCLRELGELKYTGRIELYIYNEPVRDFDWLLTCLREARTMAPRATLMIASNGDYLRGSERIAQMYSAGLNQLLINCYSPGLYEKRQTWIDAVRTYGVMVSPKVYAASGPRSRIVHMMDKSSVDTFGSGVFRIVNRAGNITPFLPAAQEPLKRMCVKPWRIFNINWRGQALVCCMDYHAQHSFSTVKDSTLVELWNHPIMNTYRKRLYAKDRSTPLCSKCDCHAGAYPHMVAKPTGPYTKELR
jgi:hypothetical protein